MRNPEFGHLLTGAINSIAAYEGKTAVAVESEIGEKIGVSPSTIQRYKSGQLPPEARMIECLAEEATRRGYLNREWLARFLRTARYPAPGVIVERLFPANPQPATTRIYQNLPAPTYNQFVMRARAYADVIDGLRQRSAVVLITSLGGMGKTSLAREVAAHCLAGDCALPNFEAVVWVSDKGREGATNLSVVLDEIARTLDYPGFTSLSFDDKRYEVEQLLRRQRVLLVVDNFETITDSALLSWLLRLPEPSKALVTSREYHAEFRSSWPVDLRGMSQAEADQFVRNQLHFLRMEALVTNPAELAPICEITGGNPKAIMIALGYLKHGQRPLAEVIDEIYAGRGNLFDDLFTRSWQLLDEAARRVLMAMTLFPVSASEAALSAVSAVQGFAFGRAAERLGELSLLDMSRPNIQSTPRYSLHPLVRAFASAHLKEHSGFEQQARQHWVALCLGWAAEGRQARYDLTKLKIVEMEEATMEAAIQWCYDNDRYPEINQLVDGMGYYYHVRGMWDKKLIIHPLAVESAHRHQDRLEEIGGLAKLVQVLSRQANWKEADHYRPRMQALVAAGPIPDENLIDYLSTESFYWLAQENIPQIEQIWQQHGHLANSANGHMVRSWLADCLLAQRKWDEAEALLRISLNEVTEKKIQRGIIAIRIKLIAIYLEQNKLAESAAALETISQLASENLDRQYMAFIQSYYARLYSLQNDLPAARDAYTQAIDLFERLGMRRELKKVRASLEAIERPSSLGAELRASELPAAELPQLP
jgi:transcriptional regulator with XRE-family HTH domain/tetratricopeptide (TPR) repeat protein